MNPRIMRSMIAASTTGLLLASAAASVFAQTAPVAPVAPTAPAAPAAGRRMRMAEELGLTPAQKKQFMTLMKTTREQKKVVETGTLTADAKKAKIKSIDESSKMQMASILTPAQVAKLKELRAAQRKPAAAGATTPGAPATNP